MLRYHLSGWGQRRGFDGGMPTMFLFLRYYGCRICQLDLRDLDLGYEAVRQAGGRVVVVLQSKREILEAAAEEKPFPYTVICDPDMKLYRQFGNSSCGRQG